MAIEVGAVFEGKVTGVKNFGAFVSLPEGKTGMVHISEVSNEFVQDIHAVLQEGQTVKVQVITIAPDGKIALSIKRLLPKPERPANAGRSGGNGGNGGFRRNNNGGDRGGNDRGGNGGNRGRQNRSEAPRVWQPKASAPAGDLSFEDMLSRFKSQSEEKMADLNRETENRRGGGYAPRSRRRG